MEKLGTNKLNMQKLLAPAALVILYIVFSIFGNNFLSLDMVKNILESSYYIGFMAFGVTFVIITGSFKHVRIKKRSFNWNCFNQFRKPPFLWISRL